LSFGTYHKLCALCAGLVLLGCGYFCFIFDGAALSTLTPKRERESREREGNQKRKE
jgi:hypothetical protein